MSHAPSPQADGYAEQGRLPLRAAITKKGAAILPAFLRALDGRGWRRAKSLTAELKVDDRALREAASQSQGQILGGQRGYCLISQASVQDVQHVIDGWKSQARCMTQRAYQVERALHQRGSR